MMRKRCIGKRCKRYFDVPNNGQAKKYCTADCRIRHTKKKSKRRTSIEDSTCRTCNKIYKSYTGRRQHEAQAHVWPTGRRTSFL